MMGQLAKAEGRKNTGDTLLSQANERAGFRKALWRLHFNMRLPCAGNECAGARAAMAAAWVDSFPAPSDTPIVPPPPKVDFVAKPR
jgi:hypothetical protein